MHVSREQKECELGEKELETIRTAQCIRLEKSTVPGVLVINKWVRRAS